jgi:tetraacyldisaccharide 4'-kinase
MNLRASIEKLINIKNPGILTSLILLPLTVCAYLYRLVVFFRTLLYQWNILRRHRIACKVIAIGNITVGGTGKTTTVCHLARCFKREGCRVVVLNRGYRGSQSGKPQVVSDGVKILAAPEAVGDEAWMLAKKLPGVPVVTGKDRVAAGKMAVELLNAQIAILDDGFQYYRLERDLDVVLINARNPFGNGFLLPRGTLREPLSALKRAPLILVTKSDMNSCNIGELEERIGTYNPDARIFKSSLKTVSLKKVQGEQEVPLDSVEGKRAVGLCSIGDPDSFFSILNSLNVLLVGKLVFPDHHTFQERDYKLIRHWTEKSELIITTEKDIARIDLDMVQKEKLLIIEIEQVIDNEELFTRSLKELAGMV